MKAIAHENEQQIMEMVMMNTLSLKEHAVHPQNLPLVRVVEILTIHDCPLCIRLPPLDEPGAKTVNEYSF